MAAVLIAPVQVDGRTVLPAGRTLRGTVREAGEPGGTAILRLAFSGLVDGRIVGLRRKRRLPSPLAAVLLARAHPVGVAAFEADVTNLLLVGSQTQVEDAFLAAGWTRARPMGLRVRLRGLLALVLPSRGG